MVKDNSEKAISVKSGTVRINLSEIYNCPTQTIEVSEEIYQALEEFRRKDESAKKRIRRNCAGFCFDEIKTGEMRGVFQNSHEDKISDKLYCENIRQTLGEKTYSRALMHFGYGMTTREIAAVQDISHTAVVKSMRKVERLRIKNENQS